MPDCLFCQIVARKSPADIEYEDDAVLAFKDIYPKAPVHLLIVPKRHIESVMAMEAAGRRGDGTLPAGGAPLGEAKGFAERGYRVNLHCGPEGASTSITSTFTSWPAGPLVPSHLIDYSLFGNQFSTPEMRAIFDERAMIQRWLDVEAALALAQAELGLIPAEAGPAIAAAARWSAWISRRSSATWR